jgi:(5-formylfuran-3-yl)methyl phosphate synthase
MTLLLASVRDAAEAEIALANGVDIIDLKDPAHGALGALPLDTIRAVRTAVAGRRPVSAVTGDLPMEPDAVRTAVEDMAGAGVDYVKVGLFADPRREACVRALATLKGRCKIVGVMFADQGPDVALLSLMAECGFAGAMLDTARKGVGRLLDHADMPFLYDFAVRCRSHGMMSGFAGSLEPPDIPRLLMLAPDVLGFRRALCARHDRKGRIDPECVRLIRDLIPLDGRGGIDERASERGDGRLSAPRRYAEGFSQDVPTDRIFVRDFVLPIRIGAYSHERQNPQSVRLDVDVTAARASRAAIDMRDVLSYDLILDAIRIVAAQEHIALVETLAEQIAAFLLGHPRVVSVKVRAEKLDVGPGGVGIEITRERQTEVAKVYQLYPAATKARPAE